MTAIEHFRQGATKFPDQIQAQVKVVALASDQLLFCTQRHQRHGQPFNAQIQTMRIFTRFTAVAVHIDLVAEPLEKRCPG